jgi:hypothetical protein
MRKDFENPMPLGFAHPRPLAPPYCCEPAGDSPSPGGEGRGEGGCVLLPQGLDSFLVQSVPLAPGFSPVTDGCRSSQPFQRLFPTHDHWHTRIPVILTTMPPAREPWINRTLKPMYNCEPAADSPSPGGEGRGEGGRILFPQGLASFLVQSVSLAPGFSPVLRRKKPCQPR